MLRTGLIGLAITLAINLWALLARGQPSAEFFSNSWWTSWFVVYVVWIVFVIIGLGRQRRAED